LWNGDVPYRDFFDFIMPGTFYFCALAYAVAGPTIVTARVATALLNATSCGLGGSLDTFGLQPDL
jgi:hypothetical protein